MITFLLSDNFPLIMYIVNACRTLEHERIYMLSTPSYSICEKWDSRSLNKSDLFDWLFTSITRQYLQWPIYLHYLLDIWPVVMNAVADTISFEYLYINTGRRFSMNIGEMLLKKLHDISNKQHSNIRPHHRTISNAVLQTYPAILSEFSFKTLI